MRNIPILILLVAFAFPVSRLSAAKAQGTISIRATTRIDERLVAQAVPNPQIEAYDLSPNGDRVAVFVVSGDLVQAPTWIVVVSTADSRILGHARVGTSGPYAEGYAPQIAFAVGGSLLIVDDGQTVSIFDARTLVKVRSISSANGRFSVPAAIARATKSPIVAISFGTGEPVLNYMDKRPVYTVMIDLLSGKQVAGWNADDVPFSMSPNGELIALSDHSTAGPAMSVAIVDAKSGERVATLSGGYGTREGAPKEQCWTRIIAKFISDDDVILTPDGNKDQSGRDIGATLKVVHFKDAQIIQEIDPEGYGPTGEIAVSADRNIFVSISRHVPAKYLTHHWRIPAGSNPELLVFSKRQMFKLDTRVSLPPLLTLRMRRSFESADLRISADGAVISIAEDYGVTVLTRK